MCVYLPSVSLRLLHDESMRMTSSNASPITEKEESRTQGLLLCRYAMCAQQKKKKKKCYVLESQGVVRTRIGHTRGGTGWNSTQFQKGWFWLQLKVFLNNTSFFRFNVRAHLPYLLSDTHRNNPYLIRCIQLESASQSEWRANVLTVQHIHAKQKDEQTIFFGKNHHLDRWWIGPKFSATFASTIQIFAKRFFSKQNCCVNTRWMPEQTREASILNLLFFLFSSFWQVVKGRKRETHSHPMAAGENTWH